MKENESIDGMKLLCPTCSNLQPVIEQTETAATLICGHTRSIKTEIQKPPQREFKSLPDHELIPGDGLLQYQHQVRLACYYWLTQGNQEAFGVLLRMAFAECKGLWLQDRNRHEYWRKWYDDNGKFSHTGWDNQSRYLDSKNDRHMGIIAAVLEELSKCYNKVTDEFGMESYVLKPEFEVVALLNLGRLDYLPKSVRQKLLKEVRSRNRQRRQHSFTPQPSYEETFPEQDDAFNLPDHGLAMQDIIEKRDEGDERK